MSILKAALQYASMGFSVIPIQRNKRPYLKWEPYQSQKADEAQIREWWKNWPNANVGIVTGAVSGLCVVDSDSPEGREKLEELLPNSLITPIATTAGGGWHYYFLHRNGLRNAARFLQDTDLRAEGGYIIAPPSMGYAWMQELSIEQVAPAELPDCLYRNLYLYWGVDTLEKSSPPLALANRISFNQGSRDESLFHVANCLVKGGMPQQEIKQFLTLIASKLCTPPFPEKEIPIKIESALKRFTTRDKALSDEVREWVLSTDGHFLSTDVYNCLGLSTRKDKKNVSEIFARLLREGLIERAGNKNGCFRKLDSQCDTIQWETASGGALELLWPLGLEEKVTIYPKSVVVIAGAQNVGKSCFALNFAYMNRDKAKIRYLSSEMAADELKNRLALFGMPYTEWRKIDFRERSQNFGDVVLPGALNIVNYYEIDRDFWRVAGDLRRIYERLKDGIALVCLQKTQGKDAGRGGDFGLEKPRLYLNLDADPPHGGVLTIRKAKAWPKGTKNPNWEEIRFKIINGSEIRRIDD